MSQEPLFLDLGFAKLVAEVSEYDGYREIYVGLVDNDGCWAQDVAVIGNETLVSGDEVVQKDGVIVVRVYADKDNEDYTNRFCVGVHKE